MPIWKPTGTRNIFHDDIETALLNWSTIPTRVVPRGQILRDLDQLVIQRGHSTGWTAEYRLVTWGILALGPSLQLSHSQRRMMLQLRYPRWTGAGTRFCVNNGKGSSIMTPKRRLWLGLMGLFAAAMTTNAPAIAQQPSQKPNILFIMGDDIGWMQPSIYHRGLMVGETPNIDRIGNEG